MGIKSLWIFKHRCVVSFIMTKKDMQNLHELLQIGGNRSCADCGVGAPDWASVNIGVFICVNCSGIHRMLGVHISRIRSVRLDQWAEDILCAAAVLREGMLLLLLLLLLLLRVHV